MKEFACRDSLGSTNCNLLSSISIYHSDFSVFVLICFHKVCLYGALNCWEFSHVLKCSTQYIASIFIMINSFLTLNKTLLDRLIGLGVRVSDL